MRRKSSSPSRYFERLQRAKARTPEIGKEYDAVMAELLKAHRYRDEHFRLTSWNVSERDHAGALEYEEKTIKPLRLRLGALFSQLMAKRQ